MTAEPRRVHDFRWLAASILVSVLVACGAALVIADKALESDPFCRAEPHTAYSQEEAYDYLASEQNRLDRTWNELIEPAPGPSRTDWYHVTYCAQWKRGLF